MSTTKRAADALSVSEGMELGCLAVDECFNGLGKAEHDFLDAAAEYIAINSDNKPNKLGAWKCLKELRELTGKPSAKEAILSVVDSGQYPSNVAEFRNTNFATIELGYKYLGSIEPVADVESAETVSASGPQEQPVPSMDAASMQQTPQDQLAKKEVTKPESPVVEPKMVQPFTVDNGTVSMEQLQKNMNGNADGITRKLNGAVEKLTTPEMIGNIENSLMPIIDAINNNPNTVINLLNGLSALLVTPAPQQGQPNIQVQTCSCGHQH